MQRKIWPPFVMRNVTVSCSIPGNEDKNLSGRGFGAELGGSRRLSRGWGPHAGGGQGGIPQLGTPQHRRAPVRDSASGLAKLTDVLNFLKQMRCNLPSVQTPGSQNYLMGCEWGRTDFIPGIPAVGGSHDLLLRSRKPACGFLDMHLVFS